MACMCAPLRDRCSTDAPWEHHLRLKWGHVLGTAARKEWEAELLGGRAARGSAAADPPQELGRDAGMRVPALLLLDRLPLAPQEASHPRAILRRCRRAHPYPRPRRAADGHGGRVVPGARVWRVLDPRAGVKPRGVQQRPSWCSGTTASLSTRTSCWTKCTVERKRMKKERARVEGTFPMPC
jgi:hypothetical protein